MNSFDKDEKELNKTKCGFCGKEIPDSTDYYCLNLHREVENEGIITVKSSVELAYWCADCYEEQRGFLKTDSAVLPKT